MPEPLERHEVEALLQRLPLRAAPDDVWDDVRTRLDTPDGSAAVLRRTAVPRWLAAAAVVLALLSGATVGVVLHYRAPSSWTVEYVSGAPSVAGASVDARTSLDVGEWLVTDARSTAALRVGRIGTAEVGPSSRVRLERGGFTEHRLTLERGSLHAAIAAPPRLFLVETPSALVTDLGCEYTLEVDSTGASRLHVTAGWVELREGGVASVVPAGQIADVHAGGTPGTPYPESLPQRARQALHRLDDGTGTERDLTVLLDAQYDPTDHVTLRKRSAVTLWHLLQRVRPEWRVRVYDRLAALSAPPDGVTREGILRLDRPMLERWRRDLNPMWSEDAQSWWTRLTRRLWERAIGSLN